MIVILNLNPKTYITKESIARIVSDVVAQSDRRYIVEQPKARVINVDLEAIPAETVAGIPLTQEQWDQFAIIPFVPAENPQRAELLRLIDEQRGYSSPVAVPAGMVGG